MKEYEKIKRKILIGNEYNMKTLYKAIGKLGTHGSTLFWLFDKPEIGKTIACICNEHDVVTDANLMHQNIHRIIIDNIRESDGFIFVSKD